MATQFPDVEVLLQGFDELFGRIQLFGCQFVVFIPPLLIKIAHDQNANTPRVGGFHMAAFVEQVSAFKNVAFWANHEVIPHIVELIITHVEVFNLLGVFVALAEW